MAEPTADELEASRMSLTAHLTDLRDCLVRSLLAVALTFCATYYFSDVLIHFLEMPLVEILPPGKQHLYFTGVTDKFFIYLQVSCLAAVVISSPYLLYQLWIFVSPALYRDERRFAVPFVFFASGSFVLGVAFGYYVVLPHGYRFLIEFGSSSEKAAITLTEYFSLTLKLLGALGAVFEIPVFILLLAKFGIVDAALLRRFRRHAVLVNGLLAAMLTPTPDAFTMLLVMVPLCLLYEVSILGAALIAPRNR